MVWHEYKLTKEKKKNDAMYHISETDSETKQKEEEEEKTSVVATYNIMVMSNCNDDQYATTQIWRYSIGITVTN